VGDPEFMEIRAEIIEDDMRDIKIGRNVVITSPVLEQDFLIGTGQGDIPTGRGDSFSTGVVQRRVPVHHQSGKHRQSKNLAMKSGQP
jgi:HlyD family secretion protein